MGTSSLYSLIWIFLGILTVFLSMKSALAQGMMSGMACPAFGFGMMILIGILILAVISALVALTIYLVRHSRNRPEQA